jgi:hypothetical protein
MRGATPGRVSRSREMHGSAHGLRLGRNAFPAILLRPDHRGVTARAVSSTTNSRGRWSGGPVDGLPAWRRPRRRSRACRSRGPCPSSELGDRRCATGIALLVLRFRPQRVHGRCGGFIVLATWTSGDSHLQCPSGRLRLSEQDRAPGPLIRRGRSRRAARVCEVVVEIGKLDKASQGTVWAGCVGDAFHIGAVVVAFIGSSTF